MKTFDLTNRMSAQAKKAILNTISTHYAYQKSYFFRPDSTANGRRRKEQSFAKFNPPFDLRIGDRIIGVRPSYSESCSSVYYSLSVTITENGKTTKGNIGTLKNLVK